jgi:hypothetical protein
MTAEAKIRLNGPGAGDAELNKVVFGRACRADAGIQCGDAAGGSRAPGGAGGENIRWQDLLRWDKDGIVNLDTIVSKPKAASPLPPIMEIR